MTLLECYVKTKCEVERDRISIVWILRIYTSKATALDGEQVLCTDIHAQALHRELGGDALWEIVTQLDGAQLQVTAVLYPIAGNTFFIVIVRESKSRNIACRIVHTPCTEEAASLVQVADVKTCPDIGLLLQVGDDVYSLHTLEESSEVEVLVLQVDVETISEVGHWIVNPSLVKLSDLAVMVEILPAHTA